MTNKVYCLLKAQKSGVFDLQIIICRLNWGQKHRYERIFRTAFRRYLQLSVLYHFYSQYMRP